MPSLFLHRISVVRVYLSIAATAQDPAGQDPRHWRSPTKSRGENRSCRLEEYSSADSSYRKVKGQALLLHQVVPTCTTVTYSTCPITDISLHITQKALWSENTATIWRRASHTYWQLSELKRRRCRLWKMVDGKSWRAHEWDKWSQKISFFDEFAEVRSLQCTCATSGAQVPPSLTGANMRVTWSSPPAPAADSLVSVFLLLYRWCLRNFIDFLKNILRWDILDILKISSSKYCQIQKFLVILLCMFLI